MSNPLRIIPAIFGILLVILQLFITGCGKNSLTASSGGGYSGDNIENHKFYTPYDTETGIRFDREIKQGQRSYFNGNNLQFKFIELRDEHFNKPLSKFPVLSFNIPVTTNERATEGIYVMFNSTGSQEAFRLIIGGVNQGRLIFTSKEKCENARVIFENF